MHLCVLQLLFALYDAQKSFPHPAPHHDRDSLTWDICKYIQEHLTEELTYQHLQNQFFISRYQLTEVFRRNTGMTLTEYILQKRLMQVTALVRGGAGLESAVYNAGFRSYSHFYKEFVKRHNTSPRNYYSNKSQAKNTHKGD